MNYNKDDDFFGSELEKKQEEQAKQQQNAEQQYQQSQTSAEQRPQVDNFYNAVPQWDDSNKGKKPSRGFTIALLCIGLVIVFALGIVLGGLFRSGNDQILSDVLSYVRTYYYKDLTDEQWEQALASGGTGILNGLGDQYGRLLTPQEYYDLLNPTVETIVGPSYGFSFQVVEGLGVYVYDTVTDSNAYGQLFQGDLIVQLSNLKDANGNDVKLDGTPVGVINTDEVTTAQLTSVVSMSYSMTAKVLHEQELKTVQLTRSEIPVSQYNYVEFYLNTGSEVFTNVSTSNVAGCTTNTVEMRSLDELGTNVGYIRLKGFDEGGEVEFQSVLQQMVQKSGDNLRLVVDLKGNPGGSVDVAVSISSMLAHERNLSQEEISSKNLLTNNGLRITNLSGKAFSQDYYTPSRYSNYFKQDSGMIVVWTDGNSASASEMLTGVLTDYKTTVQMGTRTYGKGIAQTAIELPYQGTVVTNSGATTNGPWALYFTVASYYSPLGNNIHGVGYTPSQNYNNLSQYSDLVTQTNSYFAR